MMQNRIMMIFLFFIPFYVFSGSSDIDQKAYGYCEKQFNFFFLSAIASTGRNIKMSGEYPELPEYRVLGRNLLLGDQEIDSVVSTYRDERKERQNIIRNHSEMSVRNSALICSQIPSQHLITYHRLKRAGFIE
ncbi:hypothetical protein [Pectobacterium aroidearum]|uniref:hypothetical protein n=1 Tax=Pectobacterium aroidearum TaxID=1201031 RepID=UPI003017D346